MMVTYVLVFVAALLPALILLYYIYQKDDLQQEPASWLLKGFGYGVLSAFCAVGISLSFARIGLYSETESCLSEAVRNAFWSAAIPEECAKLFMLWLLLRRNPYFDEHMDGIVYCVCIGMGFAGFENVLYLISNYEQRVTVGIMRALISVPGHFFFAVLMGYYYSLSHFEKENRIRNLCLMIATPVLAHGLFDACLFYTTVAPGIAFVIMIIFLYGFNRLRKHCSQLIRKHRERDYTIMESKK